MYLRYRSILVLFVLFLPAQGWAQTDSLKAIASYKKIGLKDQLDLIYEFDGPGAKDFDLPELQHFIKTVGPVQSQNTTARMDHGTMVYSSSIKLAYTLKPTDTGTFVIDPAVMKTNDGRAIRSNALTIQVVSGSIVSRNDIVEPKTPEQENYFLLMKLFKYKEFFVVTAGPINTCFNELTRPADSLAQIKVLKTLKTAIEKYTTCIDQGTYLCGNEMPRKYFSVKDTTGVRAALDAIYRQDPASVYVTTIEDMAAYAGKDDQRFINAQNLFGRFDSLTKILAQQGKDTTQPRTIVLTWHLGTEDKREQFSAAVKKAGYTIEDNTEEQRYLDSHNIKLLALKISKRSELDHRELTGIAAELARLAIAFNARYTRMDVTDK